MIKLTPEYIEELNRTQTYRNVCTLAVTEAAKKNDRVVYVVADLGRAMQGHWFYDEFPDRYVQVGIAEQNLIGVSAGLASCGLVPCATTFAPFATLRCLEQIRNDCAYASTDVKILGTESGVSMGQLGVTHLGWEDLGAVRSIPGLTILSPADGVELIKCIRAAVETPGPVYIRVPGGKVLANVYGDDYEFEIGKSILLREGGDVTLIASGSTVALALMAAEQLWDEGVHAAVLNIHTIKPFDAKAVLERAQKTRDIIAVEEHNVTGGLGTAVAEVLASAGVGRLVRIGLPDAFPITASPYKPMLERYGLTVGGIAEAARKL